MTIEFEYDPLMDCIVITAEGVIEYADLSTIMEGLLAHEKFRQNVSQVLDCTQATLDIAMNDIKRFAINASKLDAVLGQDRKFAIVVSKDIDFAQARQYDAFLQVSPGVQVQIFRSLDEGRAWIVD